MSAYLDWHVGMKVVCVSPPEDKGYDHERPVANRIYTLREIGVGVGGAVIVKLDEIFNAKRRYSSEAYGSLYGEIGFGANHFRPVQKRATSIEIFKQLLISPKVPEPV